MWLILSVCISVFCSFCAAQTNGNCELEGVSDVQWSQIYTNEIRDDHEKNLFAEFVTRNVKGVTDTTNNVFVDVKYEDGLFTIRPSEMFEMYEIESNSTRNPAIMLELTFTCTSGERKFSFVQPIFDHNTFYPLFGDETYSYNLPMPFVPKIPVRLFGNIISVTDYDITNMEVKFSIEPEGDFIVQYDGVIDNLGKQHAALVTAARPLRLTGTKNYTLTATDQGNPTKSKTATMIIEVDEENSMPRSPEFTSIFYLATYDISDKLSIEDNIKINYGSNAVVSITGEYSTHFDGTNNNGEVIIKLRDALPSEIRNKAFITLTLEADVTGAESIGRAALIVEIEVPITTVPTPTTTTTDESTEEPETPPPTTVPTTTTDEPVEEPTSPSTPEPSTDKPETTEPEITYPDTTMTTKETTTEEVTEPKDTTGTSGSDPTTTITPPTDNDTTTKPPGNIWFKEEVFVFILQPSGSINKVLEANSKLDEDIVYELVSQMPESIPDKLHLERTTGRLTTTGYLNSGLYQLNVVATGVKSLATASVPVVINVASLSNARYSFYTTHVDENTASVIFTEESNAKEGNYIFDIESQYPHTNEEYFFINKDTGYLQCNDQIDRESEIFSHMSSAQFRLILRLKNINSIGQRLRRNSNIVDYKNYVFNKHISKSSDQMQCVYLDSESLNEVDKTIVSVIIGDKNDNEPKFEKYKMVVGYPSKELASLVSPPYIFEVKATDADAGDNAHIRYQVDNSRVFIHPDTGIIYPSSQFFDDNDFTFNVIAQDQNGRGLKSDKLEIEVKLLEQKHISMITFSNIFLENLDEELNGIYNSTKIVIRKLFASVLPPSVSLTNENRETVNNKLIVTAYALDSENQLMTTSDLQSLLDNVAGLNIRPVSNNPSEGDVSTTGLLVAVVLLGILLALAIIGFAAVYYFKLRKTKPYDEAKWNKKSNFEIASALSPNMFRNEKETNPKDKRSTDIDSPRRKLSTNTETHDNLRERRKSVTFNKDVHEIKIDKTLNGDQAEATKVAKSGQDKTTANGKVMPVESNI